MEFKVYESTAGCGYQQVAYVLPYNRQENGDLLCIVLSHNTGDDSIYVTGETIELHDIYLTESSKKLENFPINNSMLFGVFLTVIAELPNVEVKTK